MTDIFSFCKCSLSSRDTQRWPRDTLILPATGGEALKLCWCACVFTWTLHSCAHIIDAFVPNSFISVTSLIVFQTLKTTSH